MTLLPMVMTALVGLVILLIALVAYKMVKKQQQIALLKAQLKKKRLEAESEKTKAPKGGIPPMAAMGGGDAASGEEDSRFRPTY